MTGQEEYPRFISNRPCGNDKYEGKSQELFRMRVFHPFGCFYIVFIRDSDFRHGKFCCFHDY